MNKMMTSITVQAMYAFPGALAFVFGVLLLFSAFKDHDRKRHVVNNTLLFAAFCAWDVSEWCAPSLKFKLLVFVFFALGVIAPLFNYLSKSNRY